MPTRRMRPPCCARTATGHAATPASVLMNSRRRIWIAMRPSHGGHATWLGRYHTWTCCAAGFPTGLCRLGVISLGGDRGRGSVYVRSTSHRVEILCTAAKDAKCQKLPHAPQQTALSLENLVG